MPAPSDWQGAAAVHLFSYAVGSAASGVLQGHELEEGEIPETKPVPLLGVAVAYLVSLEPDSDVEVSLLRRFLWAFFGGSPPMVGHGRGAASRAGTPCVRLPQRDAKTK